MRRRTRTLYWCFPEGSGKGEDISEAGGHVPVSRTTTGLARQPASLEDRRPQAPWRTYRIQRQDVIESTGGLRRPVQSATRIFKRRLRWRRIRSMEIGVLTGNFHVYRARADREKAGALPMSTASPRGSDPVLFPPPVRPGVRFAILKR